MHPSNHDPLVTQQIAYYQARAQEYDEWFLRKGRYDRGPQLNEQWFREVAHVRKALQRFHPSGHMLELACGTGLWTEQLLRYADRITAVDAVEEVLTLNQNRLQSSRVAYLQADIFNWKPAERYDTIFFGFWLSHVPPERFEDFWQLVRSALAENGRVFFVDSAYEATSTAVDHRLKGREATIAERRLNDGRTFQIVKVFYQPEQLSRKLQRLGWHFEVEQTEHYFVYGSSHVPG